MIFLTNPFIFCIARRFGQRLQPIFRQFVNLIDGLKSSPKTLRYTENKWISKKNQNKLFSIKVGLFHLSLNSAFQDSYNKKVRNLKISRNIIWENLTRKHLLECTFFLKNNAGINIIH